MKLFAISLLFSASACAPFTPQRHSVPYRMAVVQVDNRGPRDLDVFALHTTEPALWNDQLSGGSTARVRLGRVSANTRTEFPIPPDFLSDQYIPVYERFTRVRFLINRIDGKRSVVDEDVIVTPVDTVTFTIPPT